MMKRLFLAAGLALAACTATTAPPLEAQLASACDAVATGYRVAAVNRAQGKLSAGSIATLTQLEPAVSTACDPTHPPADLTTAVNDVLAAVDAIALANAGVH